MNISLKNQLRRLLNLKRAILLLLLTLSSCITPERCAERFPGSSTSVITIKDTTIFTTSTRFDTIFSLGSRDTVFMVDRLTDIKVKVVRLPGDSIFVSSICPPDTIRVPMYKTETTVEKILNIFPKQNRNFFLSVFLIILGLMAIAYVFRTIRQ
jgi:hypothetical protein